MPRLPTGIEGFDAMVQGGLPMGSSVILQGPPGQEKLRFALAFIAEGLRAGASGLVVTSSQSSDAILSELRNLGVNLDLVLREGRLRVVDWYSWSEETVRDIEDRGAILRSSIDLTNLGVALSRAITALAGNQPRRAVIELLSPATNVYDLSQVYAFAQSAKKKFDRYRFTSLVLLEKEMHSGSEITTLHQPFDGVIEIERTRTGDRIIRKIGVLHLKETSPDPTFRVLEIESSGMRVVRKAAKPAPASTAPPGTVLESQKERARRLTLIQQIAGERLKLNPRDTDALFATAAAQATLDDPRAALQSLDRLAELDSNYPGLWVLKTKLHARLGEPERARQSRLRAQQAELVPGPSTVATVPCPMCESPVATDATACNNCGVRFAPSRKLEDELEDLGHAAIQQMVEEDFKESLPPAMTRETLEPKRVKPKPEAPRAPEVEPTSPPKPVPKATSKKGLTNGLVLSRSPTRRPGMTNGLRGRTNGVRGRTNGLTNGLGRTNGLTNGVGRTNGLANGLGRTNGLTNGLGRTNGLTNGLGRTNGITNGLGRTNGITNGLGRTNGLTNGLGGIRSAGFRSGGFRGMMRTAGWKLYIIPLVVVGLLLMPLFFVPEYSGPAYRIHIDGQFDDWNGVPRVPVASGQVADANVDLVQVAVVDNIDYLSLFLEVRGNALQGDPSPSRVMDTFFAFLDTDRSATTGYQIQGLGADRLIMISGWGGQLGQSNLLEFDSNRDRRDWGGWSKPAPVAAAASGNRVEFQAGWDLFMSGKAPIFVAFAARGHQGLVDISETTATSASPYVRVAQSTAAPILITGTQTSVAQFMLEAVGGDMQISGLNATLVGTFQPNTFSTMALQDAAGSTIARVPLSGAKASFAFSPITIPSGSQVTWYLEPAVSVADGTTVGAFIAGARDVVASSGGVALRAPLAVPRSLGYVGAVPTDARPDGAFADWSNLTSDPLGDSSGGTLSDIDIARYGFQNASGSILFYAETAGTALNGTLIPAANQQYTSGGTSASDSDRDGVPDAADLFPYDFDNNGVPDASTNGDYDGDGVTDYGFPGGVDWWLNTTIPSTFPAPYAGRQVSVFIGPVQRPVERGEDVARFYLDHDGMAATGFAAGGLGADYLVEVTGKGGEILSSTAHRFSGLGPWQWSWERLGSALSGKDRARLEVQLAGVPLTNASIAYVEMSAWGGVQDSAAPTLPASAGPKRAAGWTGREPIDPSSAGDAIQPLDITGNQRFYLRNTDHATETACTVNKVGSSTQGTGPMQQITLTTGQSACWYVDATSGVTIPTGSWETLVDIASSGGDATSQGPLYAGGTGTNGFTNPSNAVGSGETTCAGPNYGSAIVSGFWNNFGFSIPSTATINGILVEVKWSWQADPPSAGSTGITVAKSEAVLGTEQTFSTTQPASSTACGASQEIDSKGGSTDLWGLSWTPTDVNSASFAVRIRKSINGQEHGLYINWLRASIYYTLAQYDVELQIWNTDTNTVAETIGSCLDQTTYGNDVQCLVSGVAQKTLTANQVVRIRVAHSSAAGTVTIDYDDADATGDSRVTIPIPEFPEMGGLVASTLLLLAIVRRLRLGNARAIGRVRDRLGVKVP